jgi:hypothetical protein
MSTTSLNRNYPPCSCCWHSAYQSRIPDDAVHVPDLAECPGADSVSQIDALPAGVHFPECSKRIDLLCSLIMVSVERPRCPTQI